MSLGGHTRAANHSCCSRCAVVVAIVVFNVVTDVGLIACVVVALVVVTLVVFDGVMVL